MYLPPEPSKTFVNKCIQNIELSIVGLRSTSVPLPNTSGLLQCIVEFFTWLCTNNRSGDLAALIGLQSLMTSVVLYGVLFLRRFGTDSSKTGTKYKRAMHTKQRVRPQDIQAIEEQIEQEDRPQKKRRLKASQLKMLLHMLLSVGLLIALLPTITATADQQLTNDLCCFVGSDHLLQTTVLDIEHLVRVQSRPVALTHLTLPTT